MNKLKKILATPMIASKLQNQESEDIYIFKRGCVLIYEDESKRPGETLESFYARPVSEERAKEPGIYKFTYLDSYDKESLATSFKTFFYEKIDYERPFDEQIH